jgi:hypothetical protein
MNRRWLVLSALLLPALHSDAAVMSRDWKTPGDGLLTYDDVNRREWLDLSQSRLSLFAGVGQEQQYQSVVSELTPDGALEGFLVAKSEELRSLAASAGIDITNNDIANESATRQLIALVGPSESFPDPDSGRAFSIALLDELRESPTPPHITRSFGELYVSPTDGANGSAGIRFPRGLDVEVSGTGVWLYRNEIPEPGSLAIAACCISLWTFRRNLVRASA